MKTRALLFAAAAVIATLTGALVGALTLPRSEAGSVRDLPPPSSDPRPAPSPSPTFEISGPCDEAEHALEPECLEPPDDDDHGDDDDDNSGPGGGGNSGPG